MPHHRRRPRCCTAASATTAGGDARAARTRREAPHWCLTTDAAHDAQHVRRRIYDSRPCNPKPASVPCTHAHAIRNSIPHACHLHAMLQDQVMCRRAKSRHSSPPGHHASPPHVRTAASTATAGGDARAAHTRREAPLWRLTTPSPLAMLACAALHLRTTMTFAPCPWHAHTRRAHAMHVPRSPCAFPAHAMHTHHAHVTPRLCTYHTHAPHMLRYEFTMCTRHDMACSHHVHTMPSRHSTPPARVMGRAPPPPHAI